MHSSHLRGVCVIRQHNATCRYNRIDRMLDHPYGRIFGNDENSKNIVRVESLNRRLYLHGQNAARFSSRGRRVPSTVCRLFSHCHSSSQTPKRRGYLYQFAGYAGKQAAPHSPVQSHSAECDGLAALSFRHEGHRLPLTAAVLNAVDSFAFSLFHGGQHRPCLLRIQSLVMQFSEHFRFPMAA